MRSNPFPVYPTTSGWWDATTAAANTTVLQPYQIAAVQYGSPSPAKTPEPAGEPTPRKWLDSQIEETCALAGIAA